MTFLAAQPSAQDASSASKSILLYHRTMPIPERMNPTFATAEPPAINRHELAREKLIVALDVPAAASAAALVARLEDTCLWFKVGIELFTAAGPAILEPLLNRGHSVFLDLKFHDIPNTVAGAVRSAAALGARMLTIHAAGGPAMLIAAHTALAGLPDPPQLLAVTMLTSIDQAQAQAIGFQKSPSDQALALASMALDAGINGFVCSPHEVSAIRALAGPDAVLAVPGIRPAGANLGDQKRVGTPAETLRLGASYLVVGRPITQAPDPARAASLILDEMAEAL
jgi:orotidine-5'-phosphate decarboxylase